METTTDTNSAAHIMWLATVDAFERTMGRYPTQAEASAAFQSVFGTCNEVARDIAEGRE